MDARERFVVRFFDLFLETLLTDGRITAHRYYKVRDALRRSRRELTALLFASVGRGVEVPGLGTVRRIRLREPNLREFDFLQVLPRRARARPRLTCFVGHRFKPNIERSLRYNLQLLFEPYRIRLRWSGYDLQARDVFTDIVRHIRAADICIFDNLGTLNRPNVYIEAGIAYALERPAIVCEYVGHVMAVPDTGSIPSDLRGLFRVMYKTYEELSQKLYFSLPVFLKRSGLLGG